MCDFQIERPSLSRFASRAVASISASGIFYCLMVCGVVLGPIGASTASAADFKLENKVFSGSEKQPYSHTTTIFRAGIVYDYLADPENPDEVDEVTVFDFARGRFVLLDMRLKLKTELSSRLVKASTDSLKIRTDLADDPFASFLLNPAFEQEVVEDAAGDGLNELLFNSKWLDYRVIVSAADSPEVAGDYRCFSDWYARLNTYVRPGSLPPFARLIVNEALGKRGELPREVHLTLKPKQGFAARKVRFHSEHAVTPHLGDGDRRRVAKTADDLTVFEAVDFKEYNKRRAESKAK